MLPLPMCRRPCSQHQHRQDRDDNEVDGHDGPAPDARKTEHQHLCRNIEQECATYQQCERDSCLDVKHQIKLHEKEQQQPKPTSADETQRQNGVAGGFSIRIMRKLAQSVENTELWIGNTQKRDGKRNRSDNEHSCNDDEDADCDANLRMTSSPY